MRRLPLLVFLLVSGSMAMGRSVLDDVQDSHITANVPHKQVFADYLTRDVLAYLQAEASPDTIAVQTSLLRLQPTQSGVAYPKYYLWVTASLSNHSVLQGAMRVAAVNGQGFDVTHFIRSEQIASDPQVLTAVFPAALIPAIRARAAHK